MATYTLKQIERHIIVKRLKKFNNNRTDTAKSLDISIRTLQRKIKKFNSQVIITE